MLRHIKNTALAMTLSAAAAVTAQAQTVTCGNTSVNPATAATCQLGGTSVSGTLNNIVFISLTNGAYGLTMPVDGDFTAGGTVQKLDVAAQVATIRANANWTLTIKGAAWTGTGNTGKNIGDLAWNLNAGGYTALTGSAVTLTSGAPTQAVTATIGYRTLWSLDTDKAGTYNMALTFVITAL